MDRLWGEMAPVPEKNVNVLAGSETVSGFRVTYAPGHASHHVAYLHEATGDAYVGDVGGVRVPPSDFTVAPTPPPDVDVEAWNESLDAVMDWSPASLCLTHYGRAEDVSEQVERVRESLERHSRRSHGSDEDTFVAALVDDLHAHNDAEIAERLQQAAPPDQLWLGLERYWRKRELREAAAAGLEEGT